MTGRPRRSEGRPQRESRWLRNLVTITGTAVVVLLAGAAGTAQAAQAAGIGVGVGAAPIQPSTPLHPNSAIALPSLYVVNTGTVTSDYDVRVEQIGATGGRTVPASWVSISPTAMTLTPAGGGWVALRLHVPAGAAAGHYASDLVAAVTTTADTAGAAARFGDQAATKLLFIVTSTASTAFTVPGPVWAWLTGLGVVALLVGWRRSGLHVHIQRS